MAQEELNVTERRKYKRINFVLPVTVKARDKGKTLHGKTANLSAGGMALLLDSFLPLGKSISIDFKIQDDTVFENVIAKILRVNDVEDGFLCGVEFLNLQPADIEKINRIANSVHFIKGIKLFSHINDEESFYLKNIGKEESYTEGKTIFKEGADGDAFYAVISGKVRITKKSAIDDKNQEVLALIREGEFFGEMALFDEGTRTANASAHTDTVLFVITADAFNTMIKNNYKLAIKLLLGFIRTLSKRLKSMNQEMVDLLFSEAALTDIKK